jgi:pSer/pThr/pTyr-binding forkhead associated (FHA) protein
MLSHRIACSYSYLQPVCEATGRQSSIDLTRQACFRIGRSPNAHVQLFHATSSRRHAMMFHHENGSCYIVDCGSAHGTFLNGQRITSPSVNGVSVPHKVRRGAMVRFGGPGAPCFILKSFSFNLEEIKDYVDSVDPLNVVRRNTRLNALGESASSIVRNHNLATTIEAALGVTRKRSFDSLDSRDTIDEIPVEKRSRCSSPELSPLSPLRLVSPDLPLMASKRRVTFSPESPQLFYPTLDAADEAAVPPQAESAE